MKLKESTIQVLQGDVPFSGFRLCHECGTVDQLGVEQYPYGKKVRCKCGLGDMTPLTDKEVMYYLSQHMKAKNKLREFSSFLNSGIA